MIRLLASYDYFCSLIAFRTLFQNKVLPDLMLIVKLLCFTRCHISADCCQCFIQDISDIEV